MTACLPGWFAMMPSLRFPRLRSPRSPSVFRRSDPISALSAWNGGYWIGGDASPIESWALTEEAALAYCEIMWEAIRRGQPMSAPDGMIAAIVRVNGGRLAMRNPSDFASTGLELMSPWDF